MTILVVVLVVLGIMFLVSYSSEFKQVILGLAGGPGIPADTCSEYCGELAPGECIVDEKPRGCPDSDEGGIYTCGVEADMCGQCGCFSSDYECQSDGTCLYIGGGDSDNSGGDITPSCSDPDGDGISDDCGSSRVCIDGRCEESVCGDLVCDYRSETCSDCLEDCEGGIGILGGCVADNHICEEHPIYAGMGICQEGAPDSCEDGTPVNECSVTIPLYCTTDLILEDDCTGGDSIFGNENDCSCPEGETCNELTGICYISEIDDTQESPPLEEPVDNYCEYVGGICIEECQGGYYPLDEDEYDDLVSDCKTENENYQCCYPFENDEENDCTYYGGSCLSECGDNSYYAEIDYLDDECEYYEGENTICCIPYPQQESGKEIEDLGEGSLIDAIFGGDSEDSSDDNKYSTGEIRLSESVSLNREVFFGALAILLVIAFIAILVFLRKGKMN